MLEPLSARELSGVHLGHLILIEERMAVLENVEHGPKGVSVVLSTFGTDLPAYGYMDLLPTDEIEWYAGVYGINDLRIGDCVMLDGMGYGYVACLDEKLRVAGIMVEVGGTWMWLDYFPLHELAKIGD